MRVQNYEKDILSAGQNNFENAIIHVSNGIWDSIEGIYEIIADEHPMNENPVVARLDNLESMLATKLDKIIELLTVRASEGL